LATHVRIIWIGLWKIIEKLKWWFNKKRTSTTCKELKTEEKLIVIIGIMVWSQKLSNPNIKLSVKKVSHVYKKFAEDYIF
jgi:hypothetical protein